ncbi:hypothetical protein EI94DRAFT_1704192 [Lactarius quietus]|nr:hypothetical protein EI94DRAFT_1704192 [Lactarius quietus]
MRAISAATLLSIFALASSLTGVVHANSPRLVCDQTIDVEDGATCDSIAAQCGFKKSILQSMNAGINCRGTLPAGQTLCVQAHQPGCKQHAVATCTTCDALAALYNLTPDEFVDYNNSVNDDCTNLVVGKHYCIATN